MLNNVFSMKLSHLLIVSILFSFLSVITVQAAPALITYAGKVNKDGQPFNGNGQFKFAFVNAAANDTYWSHDGTSTYGAAPTGYVTLPVNGGYYSILLGNTSISGMSAIDPAIFSTHSDVHLRVWFSDGVAAFEELAPHRPFASVPYALNAGISAGSITKSMLSVDIQADLNRTITKTMLSQQILEDLNRTVDKSMLAQEVLADLNASGSGATPGGIIAVPYGQNAPAGYSPYTLGDRKGFAWTEKTAVTQARYAYDAVVALSNEIYFVGGSTSAEFRGLWGSGSNVTTVEKYNLGTNSWQAVASLPAGRFRYATAALNGKIHIMGGNGLNTCVVYDPSTNQWTSGPNLPSVVENARAVSFNGKIYLIGGEGAAGNQVLEFDPSTNQWSAKAPMTTARSGVELVVFENRIWAIGSDATQSNVAESFDPVGNSWRAETSLPNTADIAWVANGTIYCGVYGGEIFVFDSTNSLWRQSGVMPGYFDEYGFVITAAVVTGSRVHLVGGPSNGQAGFGPVNSNKHYVADLNSSVLGVRDLFVQDGNASTGSGSGGSTPAPGSITKSMLSSQVLADLNSSTPGPGSITQQMLASEVQAMLSGQSSSIFAPTLANPYGYAGGTPIEHNYSSYTVPYDKVLVILTSAYWYGNVNANGQKVRESLSGISIFPSGTVVTTSGGNSSTRNGWSGLLFDPLPHISPVIVPIGYQVPSDKVLVLTSGTGADSGGTLGGSFSRDFASSMPTIHHSGSILNAGGTGYLVDSSMLVNSGASGGGTPAAGPSGLSSSVLAPTLANPYGFSGGTTIDNNGSEYTVPGDKVLVILSTGGDVRVKDSGQSVRIFWNQVSVIPSGAVIEEAQMDGVGNLPGWTGLLMDPQAHITPVFIPTGYQVPAGKVLVATAGNFTKNGRPIGIGNNPAIFAAGSTLTLSSTSIGIGYLIDASEF